MNRIATALRFLAYLGILATATPILLIWWAVYLFVATFIDWIANIVVYGSAWCAATMLWAERSGVNLWFKQNPGDSHGSARFADRKELASLEGGHGLLIGRNPSSGKMLRYDGPAHLLTLAPTRAGKGVGTVIPNLLMADRSVIVVDPKGEDATTLADALVMDPPGQVQEAHWNEEAKAILSGLIMFCVAHEEREQRNLATVREYLTLPPDRFRTLLELMHDSDAAHGLIARAANRFLGKADREAASVLSNAQRHTHFLDSPRIADVISRSDFHFAELQQRIVSVFLVLPPNRLDAYSRWLRLLISQALQDIARHAELAAPVAAPQLPTAAPNGAQDVPGASGRLESDKRALHRPSAPTLFLLDEFAALADIAGHEPAQRSLWKTRGHFCGQCRCTTGLWRE